MNWNLCLARPRRDTYAPWGLVGLQTVTAVSTTYHEPSLPGPQVVIPKERFHLHLPLKSNTDPARGERNPSLCNALSLGQIPATANASRSPFFRPLLDTCLLTYPT